MKKSILVAVVSLCLAFSVGIPSSAFASVEPTSIGDGIAIQPFWVNVSDITLSMTYSSGMVNCRGIVQGKSNTANIDATFKLEKQISSGSYQLVDIWTASTSTTKLDKSASKTGDKGTYRLTVSATVKSTSGVSEVVTDSLIKTL